MFSDGTVAVITAATGHEKLVNCLRSVQRQTYAQVEHFVVVDGQEWQERVQEAVTQAEPSQKPLHVIELPHATGRNKWNGHRIYGAMSYLLNSEFVSYLDEDNWFDADHVESLMAAIRATQSRWAFSLRKIYDSNGSFITLDDCESLGNLHHAFLSNTHFHIDANCYLLHRELAVQCSPIWYRPWRGSRAGPCPDTLVCRHLLKHHPQSCSNHRHTVNYTVGCQPGSVRAEFFLRGNQVMRDLYPGGLPWKQPRAGEPSPGQEE